MRFRADHDHFELDGKPFFLYSGEVQYFRIQRDLWGTHLAALKAAGANTVSTYIPWSWHEVEEGVFDFTGRTDPQRDLVGFLAAAARAGLYASVKPGPYILAEFDDEGIPAWLRRGHPEIQARGVNVVTYLHPVFKRYVLRWYDAVLPLLAERQLSAGGPILLLQVCNEVGLFNWLGAAGDTGGVAVAHYRAFLQGRYRRIADLNRTYGTHYRAFRAVVPPSRPAADPGAFVRWNDWHDFHRVYYADYLSWLITEIRRRGITVQLFHNIPGWVFGRGTEYPINISFYAEIVRRHPELVFGVDHIPENPNYRNQHDDLIINEMVRALQGGRPIWAAEQQAGSREHQVRTYPNELELFYKACLGRGMTGMNLYMFSQGLNPPGRGTFGPTFYWYTALDHDGRPTSLYPVVGKIGQWVRTFGPALALTRKAGGTAVGFYRPYYHDEFYYPLFGGELKLDAKRVGLRVEPKILRNTYYFDGLLRMLVMQNRDFTMVDLQAHRPDPRRDKQLWVVAADHMDRRTQAKLAEYVEAGGHLFLWPGFPDRDLQMRPCTLLKGRLGVREGRSREDVSGTAKISLLGLKDLNVLSPIRTVSAPEGKVIARTSSGEACGLTRRVGKGAVTVLGTIFGYNIEEHLAAFSRLADLRPVSPTVEVSNPEVLAHVRYGKDHAFLCLLNYTPVPQSVRVEARRVPGLGTLRLPEQGALTLEPLSGRLIPLHFPAAGLRIRWATCEVIGLEPGKGRLLIRVQGSPRESTQFEVQVPASAARRLKVRIDGRAAAVKRTKPGVVVTLPAGSAVRDLELVWSGSGPRSRGSGPVPVPGPGRRKARA